MTYTEWEVIAHAPDLQTRRVDVWDVQGEQMREMLQVGTELFQASESVEWRDSCPMITSYVMAVGRVRLWDVMRALPERAVRYVDTDSVIVHEDFHDAVKAVADSPIGHGLRLKKSWRGLSVWGPRQIVTGELVRVSGVPRKAARVARDQFEGDVWESLEASLKRRRPDRVVISPRRWTVRGTDHRRQPGQHGWTVPRRVERSAP